LYLFALFCCLGYKVTVHPETSSRKATRPDFLLTSQEGDCLYVEAVQSIELGNDERAARARLNVVFDTLNTLEVNGWFLGVDSTAYPATPPSGKRLRVGLQAWLESLDPDEVFQRVKVAGHDAFPTFEWKDGDWRITFTAFPRPSDKRDRPVESVLGVYFGGARWLNTVETIRDTLQSKGSYYGDLGAPLVIAVNASVLHLDDIDIMGALFGDEQFIFDQRHPEAEPVRQRARNGFWYGPRGAQNERVAGIAVGFDVNPWTTAVRPLTLFHNPWSAEPVRGLITRLSQRVPRRDRMEIITGELACCRFRGHPLKLIASAARTESG
jgi:hypothetical protein